MYLFPFRSPTPSPFPFPLSLPLSHATAEHQLRLISCNTRSLSVQKACSLSPLPKHTHLRPNALDVQMVSVQQHSQVEGMAPHLTTPHLTSRCIRAPLPSSMLRQESGSGIWRAINYRVYPVQHKRPSTRVLAQVSQHVSTCLTLPLTLPRPCSRGACSRREKEKMLRGKVKRKRGKVHGPEG